MAELKDRQQIILLHGAGAFTSEKATELELEKGELVIEHGTDDVKLHTLDNSGNLATIISEKAVDAKISEVTEAQAEKDAAQDDRLADVEAILAGYGTEEDETATVKSDIDSLQGQINAIHTHDNKEVLDGITAGKVQAWDSAEQNAKDYADEKFVTKDGFNEFEAEYEEKLNNIEAGAQVNVIETVQLNGVNLAVTEKTVNVTAIEGVGADEKVIILGDDNKITTNLSITYDSGAKEIKLMSGETQIGAAIDATDFIKDGMVNSATLEERTEGEETKTYLVISFNADGGDDTVEVDVTTLLNIEQIAELDGRLDKIETILAGYGEGETATVKADIENLQGQIEGIVEDTAYLKEIEVVDPNNSIVVTPSDNKVTIDFTKLVINGGEY